MAAYEADDDDDERWSDWGEEDEERVASLLDPTTFFPSAEAALASDAAAGFELRAVIRDYNLDFYGAVRLVNCIRSLGLSDAKALLRRLERRDWLENPDFLKPTLADDGLLVALDRLLPEDDDPAAPNLQARLDSLVATLADAAATLKAALETDAPMADNLRSIARLAPEPSPEIADDDPPRVKALKQELAAATNHLLVLAKRADDLLAQ